MSVDAPPTPSPGGAALHKAVLDVALDAIVTIDAQARIVEFNPAAERIFGHAADDVVGRDLGDVIVPPELREAHRNGFRRHLTDGSVRVLDQRIETMAVRADGERFPVELAITRIPVPGEPVFTGHIRDITHRRMAEEELRRSRARLVEAADEARRAIERDLHDGAQQRLVALALELRLAREIAADGDVDDTLETLDAAIEKLGRATQELRDLARGIHPAALTEHGLAAALAALARRAAVPVRVDAPRDERFPKAIEASAYFVVAEAVTNAARHAQASEVRVTVTGTPERLTVEIRDDGAGGVNPANGSGLRGLADRVSALDGSLSIASPSGGGTTIRASWPCG